MSKGRAGAVAVLAALLGAAVTLGAASPAKAYPYKICTVTNAGPQGCKVYCRQQLADGNTADYPEGTQVTITTPDGKSRTFTCTNGSWVGLTTGGTGSVLRDLVVAPGGFATVDVPCPGIRACPPGGTIGLPPLAAPTP
jgi:hypothetical protein